MRCHSSKADSGSLVDSLTQLDRENLGEPCHALNSVSLLHQQLPAEMCTCICTSDQYPDGQPCGRGTDAVVTNAERVLTQERIKLIKLAMESLTVPPACYEVTAASKPATVVSAPPAPPRWDISHPLPRAMRHDSVQYVLSGRSDRKQSLHDGVTMAMTNWKGLGAMAANLG